MPRRACTSDLVSRTAPAPPSSPYSNLLCRHPRDIERSRSIASRLRPLSAPAQAPSSQRTTVLARRHHSTRAAARRGTGTLPRPHPSSISNDAAPATSPPSHEEASHPSAPPGHGLLVRREAASLALLDTQPAAWPCSTEDSTHMLCDRASGEDDD
jgi:hypothetical protein